MATNGIPSSAMAPHALSALRDAAMAAADPGGKFGALEAQSKSLESHAGKFQKTAIDHEVRLGTGAMAQRHINVGPGADSARARGAAEAIKQLLATVSNGLASLVNGAKTLVKHLQNYLFSPSPRQSGPAPTETAASPRPARAAAAPGQGRETAGARAPAPSPVAARNHRPGGLQQKLVEIERRAQEHQAEAAALRKTHQTR